MSKLDLQARLRQVMWIGGSPCSGKTSITGILAGRYATEAYHCDEGFEAHKRRVDQGRHPAFHHLLQLSWNEIWMRPIDVQVAGVLAIYREEFAMIVDDLAALPSRRPVIAEGAALLPELLAPIVANPNQAIWIVPTADFQLAQYPARGDWVRAVVEQCEQPDQALQNWMQRDIAFARYVAADAAARGFHVIEVDGRQSIAEVAGLVARQFHPFLLHDDED